MNSHVYDLLVIGAGPAGASTAFWAARAGLDVALVEKKSFPREKTCGDGLTPRAVHQLEEMELISALGPFHRFEGLRTIAHGRMLQMSWPTHPVYPKYGLVIRRCDLDDLVAKHAVAAGTTLIESTEALYPIEGNETRLKGAVIGHTGSRDERKPESTILADYVVVADGANSRFGRALGTSRNRSHPMGMAIRTYYESSAHDDPWIESVLDVRDRAGNAMPGYGWIFPVGDGTIYVGIGLLSTFRDYKNVNTSHLMDEFAHSLPEHWGIDPAKPLQPPTGGRLPMAGSVGPKAGSNWLLVGDAAGSVNPFNGEGIDYAYETGRLAASLIVEAHNQNDDKIIAHYPGMLEEEYGLYFKVARLFAKVIGNPTLIRELTRIGMRSKPLMEWALRVMANMLREEERGTAEAMYGAIAAVVRLAPERVTGIAPR